jgi:hypothetical protein
MGGYASGFASGLSGGLGGGGGKKDDSDSGEVQMQKFKHGGKVKRTGKAKVHKGERVLTKKQAKRYEKRKRSRKE